MPSRAWKRLKSSSSAAYLRPSNASQEPREVTIFPALRASLTAFKRWRLCHKPLSQSATVTIATVRFKIKTELAIIDSSQLISYMSRNFPIDMDAPTNR